MSSEWCQTDWYRATIPVPAHELGEILLAELPGACRFETARGRYNYHSSMLVLDSQGEKLATIYHGGPNGDPSAEGSGDRAEAFSAAVRKHWPDSHRVTRFDSAIDIVGDYVTVRDRCRALAEPSGVTGHEHDNHARAKGNTDYLGSPKSRVLHRCYEKGKQLAPKAVDAAAVDLRWLRLELQWTPDKQARDVAALVTSAQVWGVSPWTRRIAREFTGGDIERLRSRPELKTDREATHAAFLHSYGNHMRWLLARDGSPSAFAGNLIADLERTAK